MSARYCGKCKKPHYDQEWEVFTWFGNLYYLCEECAIKVREFVEKEEENGKG
jgi:hypothetical protein